MCLRTVCPGDTNVAVYSVFMCSDILLSSGLAMCLRTMCPGDTNVAVYSVFMYSDIFLQGWLCV